MPDLSDPRWTGPDREKRIAELLAEDGHSPSEITDLIPTFEKLSHWTTPSISEERIEQFANRLAALTEPSTAGKEASSSMGQAVLGSSRQDSNLAEKLQNLAQLLLSQLPLIRREIWLASAFVLALGWVVSYILDSGLAANPSGMTLALVAPLIGAVGLSLVYGPDNDVGLELALTTPTSPRQVLLSRFVLVFGYDLAITLLLSVAFKLALPHADLLILIGLWLGPMFFLGNLALLLSVTFGSDRAIQFSLVLWVLRVLAEITEADWVKHWSGLWTSTPLLLALAAGLISGCFLLVKNREYRL